MTGLLYPPSLAPDILARSFRATDGKVGLLPRDTPPFLEACRQDQVAVSGWELWVADFEVGPDGLAAAPGSWAGLIPCKGLAFPWVVGGTIGKRPGEAWSAYVERSLAEVASQIARFELHNVEEQYQPSARYNFTLEGSSAVATWIPRAFRKG